MRAYGNLPARGADTLTCLLCMLQEQEHSGEPSRMRSLNSTDLLFQLPFLQKLLERLIDCKPGGVAAKDPVVQVSTGTGKRLPRFVFACVFNCEVISIRRRG